MTANPSTVISLRCSSYGRTLYKRYVRILDIRAELLQVDAPRVAASSDDGKVLSGSCPNRRGVLWMPEIAVPVDEHQSVAATALGHERIPDQDAAITSKHHNKIVLGLGILETVSEGYREGGNRLRVAAALADGPLRAVARGYY